jgi:FixJ family two-component response regulator
MQERGVSVAIVDDDASVRKALGRLLSANSFEITTYGSVSDFMESIESGMPQCLVLDLHMPDVTGFELQRDLSRLGINIPTIVITAWDEPWIRERCVRAGAVAFLVKPLDEAVLLNAIHTATGRC